MFFSFISPRLSIIDSQVKQKQQPKKPTRKTVSDSERLSCSQKKKIEIYLKNNSKSKSTNKNK
jgi:hypothetical protein